MKLSILIETIKAWMRPRYVDIDLKAKKLHDTGYIPDRVEDNLELSEHSEDWCTRCQQNSCGFFSPGRDFGGGGLAENGDETFMICVRCHTVYRYTWVHYGP